MCVYYGDLHSHTGYSDGKGTPREAYQMARANGLDFLASTDHAELLTQNEWDDTFYQARRASVDDVFVALRGFEWSSGAFDTPSRGHLNVFNTRDFVGVTDPDYDSLGKIYTWLAEPAQLAGIAQLNHPNFPEDSFKNLAYERGVDPHVNLIEINVGDDTRLDKYRRALANGWRVAPANNSDTHWANWGVRRGRIGIVAPALTQREVMEALRARRVFSTEDENLALLLRADGHWMGALLREPPIQIDVYAFDPDPVDPIVKLTLYQNNEPFSSTVVNAHALTWTIPLEHRPAPGTWWYAEATQADGDRAFTGPIWLIEAEPYDLLARDSVNDFGAIPSADPVWQSPDVWIRQQADGQMWHQNPITGQGNVVYARLQNAGVNPLSGVDVYLYWAEAALGLRWPDDWRAITGQPLHVPSLQPGQTAVVSTTWDVPPSAPAHVSLLMRLVSDQDLIRDDGNPKWDNNVAGKSVHVLPLAGGESGTVQLPIRMTFYLNNPDDGDEIADLRLYSRDFPSQGDLTLRLAPDLFERWAVTDTTHLLKGAFVDSTSHAIVMTHPQRAAVYGLPLHAGERSTATLLLHAPHTATLALHVSQEIRGNEVGRNLYTSVPNNAPHAMWLEAIPPVMTPHSQAQIVAYVVGDGFTPIVDGVPVHFSTTRGRLSDNTVETRGGVALVTLVSDGDWGTAVVRASAAGLSTAVRVDVNRACWVRLNDSMDDYTSVQAAVDASTRPDDVIKVAGRCTGVHRREDLVQVVHVSKTVTIQGGYTVTNWITPDLWTHRSVIDAQGQGRALYVAEGVSLTLEGIHVTGGDARGLGGGPLGEDAGGGIYAVHATPTLRSNRVLGNVAGLGGGLYLAESEASLTNNIVAHNQALDRGSGLCVGGGKARLLHNTLARNGLPGFPGSLGGDGIGLYVSGRGLVTATNTILAGHAVGISVTTGSTVTLEATLWGDGAWANGADWDGDGAFASHEPETWGDPAFVAPDDGDYHIGAGSAARDRGIDAGVSADVDGEPRPMGYAHDVGADELRIGLQIDQRASATPALSGERLTYIITVTNTGLLDLHARITDTLPSHVVSGRTSEGTAVMPGQVVTWTPVITAPGGIWRQQIVVTVEAEYRGVLTNVVQVATDAGVGGSDTLTTPVITVYTLRLPLVMRNYSPPVPCAPRLIATVETGPDSHGIALDTAGRRAFVAHAGGLAVIDADRHTLIRAVHAITSVHGVAYDPERNRIWAVTRDPDRVLVLDGSTYSLLADLPAGAGPHAAGYNSANARVYVTNYWDGTLRIYDARNLTYLLELSDFAEPAHLAINPVTNKVYVANHGFYRGITVIDGATHATRRIDAGLFDAYGVTVDVTRNLVYATGIAQGRLSVIDGATDEALGYQDFRHADGGAMWLRVITVNPDVGPEGHLLLVTSSDDGERDQLLLIPNTWPTLGEPVALDIASYPQDGIVLDPRTERVWVTSVGSGLVNVIQDGEPVCVP